MTNTTTLETDSGELATTPDAPGGSRGWGNNFTYILGGAATAGGVVLVVVLLVVGLLMRRRCLRRRNSADIETAQERNGGIYDEIAEARREQQKKKKGKKPKDQDNNNDVVGIELVALDTAPDIITAHDNESIYETLDGRRAARAARANHMIMDGQSGDGKVTSDNYPLNQGVEESNYDHLNRFSRQRLPHLPPDLPEKRFTDPEVITRPQMPPKPLAVHSAECVIRNGKPVEGEAKGSCEDVCWRQKGMKEWFRASPGQSASSSLRSSLSELARHSVSGGKPIVCQLTMVGVVENGKPVPVRPAAASNTYFILEPTADSEELPNNGFQSSPAPKFRIKSEIPKGGDGYTGRQTAAAGGSDYFLLELLNQDDDLEEFEDFQHPQTSLSCEECQSLGTELTDASCTHSSLHGHHSVGSFRNMEGSRKPQSFRNTRVNSCPGDCSFTEDADASPMMVPKHLNYGRSYSSPQSTHDRRARREEVSTQKKMDAEILKARIQQEMIALGFVDDSNIHNKFDKPGSETASKRGSQSSEDLTCAVRPPRNDYFTLEPQLDGEDKDNATEPEIQIPPPPTAPCGMDKGQKPRYQQRRKAPSPPPPPLPKRNNHNRSKSETPVLVKGNSVPSQHSKPEDQGPVIVSLKKHKVVNKDTSAVPNNVSTDVDHREAFRPRFQSESGVLSERLKRQ